VTGRGLGQFALQKLGDPRIALAAGVAYKFDRMSFVRPAGEEGAMPWRGFQDSCSAPVLTEHVVMGAFVVSWRLLSAEDESWSI
jgi:hypothetical protein